jgi:hypothetical protein
MAIGRSVSGAAVQMLVSLKDDASRQLNSVTQNVEASAKRWRQAGMAMMGVGVAGAAALGIMVRKGVDYGTMIDKMAKQTGMTAEEVQKLKYAAEQEHLSFETLTKSIPMLTKYMQYAADGMATYRREFDRMGITVTDNEGKLRSTYDVLVDMAGWMSSKGISDETKLATAMTLLGRRGAEMIPFLKLGKETIQKLSQEAVDLGAVMSGESVRAAKKFGDELMRVTAPLKTMAAELGISLLPALTEWIERGKKVVKWLHDLSPEMKAFVVKGAAMASIALIIGGGLMFLAGTVKSLGVIMGALNLAKISAGVTKFGNAVLAMNPILLNTLVLMSGLVATWALVGEVVSLFQMKGIEKSSKEWLKSLEELDRRWEKRKKETGKGYFTEAEENFRRAAAGALSALGEQTEGPKWTLENVLGNIKGQIGGLFAGVADAAEKHKPKLSYDLSMLDDLENRLGDLLGKTGLEEDMEKAAEKLSKAGEDIKGSFGFALREIIGAYEYIPEMMKVQSRSLGPELMPLSMSPAFAGGVPGPGMKQVNLQFNYSDRRDLYARIDRELDREGL